MHNKGNYKQGEKTAFRMGKNNSKWNSWQRIKLKNIQAVHATQYQKNKQPSQKVGKELNRYFSKGDINMANKHMKIAQHHSLLEKCKSKPQRWIISCQSGWLSSKSLQTINAREGVEKWEPSYTLDGNAYWCSHYGEQCGIPLKKKKKLGLELRSFRFSSVQSLSCVRLFATPWVAAHEASLSITNSWSLLKFMSIKLVMQNCSTTQQFHCWAYTLRKSELKETHIHCSTVYNS